VRRVALLTLLFLAGCYSWHTRVDPPSALLNQEHPPTHVRFTLADGKRTEMWFPRIGNDSITGRDRNEQQYKTRTVALADVTRVEVSDFNAGKTIGTVVGVGVGVLLVAAVVASTGDWGSSDWGSSDGTASCPQVYSWDGERWRLDSGTFGGAFAEGLERTDYDNLDYPVPQDGKVLLRVGNELNETEQVDALQLLAVDHPAARTIVPLTDGTIVSLTAPDAPVAARDDAGRDALRQVQNQDNWSWESTLRPRDPNDPSDIRDGLTMSFVRPRGTDQATLVLDGHTSAWAGLMLTEFIAAHGATTRDWYTALNQSPALARGVGAALAREGFLSAAVETTTGWKPAGLFWEAGPEVVKRQALPLDLSGVTGDTVRVRLESIPSFWLVDRVSMTWGAPDTVPARKLPLLSAIDGQGRDVAPELRTVDQRRFTIETDEWADLQYRDAPPPAPGLTRSYLLASTGWYRIHTPEAGPVDSTLLAAVASGPGGGSRVAIMRSNTALRWAGAQ
jgi:hypothetical protein